ncbi:hypothetical protein [Streptomyces sp. NRRL S-350]|uniref:hypothetical protein n=1 Tax=Streptomyces sp. NRRL S-350 TaxID=1463902 RepID=UPI0004BF3C51|nr:hypothetical protein [Streptomyces sp. NRRL S-350]
MTGAADEAEQKLRHWVDTYAQLHSGDESWRFRSFAALVAAFGVLYHPAPWPADQPRGRLGRCFEEASKYADATGATYVEGFVLVPDAPLMFPVFEHAWCLTPQGTVADTTIPDGGAVLYLGLPLHAAFRRTAQARRRTWAVLTYDTDNLLAGVNDVVLKAGLPPGALALPNTPSPPPGGPGPVVQEVP